MVFTSYQAVRPWAKAIREKVVTASMPPWLADPHVGQFKNDRRLSPKEIETIVAWVGAGAPEGDAKDLPPPPHFEDGWNIGKPDQIVDYGADFDVPARGVVDYQYFKVATNFTEDKWLEAAEIRPQHRDVVLQREDPDVGVPEPLPPRWIHRVAPKPRQGVVGMVVRLVQDP